MNRFAAAAAACTLLSFAAQAADETFAAASIKPNASASDVMAILPPAGGRFTATNISLGILMAVAYDVRGFQISALPAWGWAEKYDIIARAEGRPSYEQIRAMLQRLLAERFELQLHRETKTMKGYALVTDKHEAKRFQVHEDECGPDAGNRGSVCGGFVINAASLDGVRVSMKQLASTLAQQRDVGRPVVDRTGIAGTFDVHLQWSAAAGDDALSVFTALQDQLGLRLEAATVETEILVVDHAERASAN